MLTYNQKETAERIRQLRRKQGWSQEQAAHRLGLTAGSLSRMERGMRGCSVELLTCIGALYEVSMDYLVFGRQSEPGMDRRMRSACPPVFCGKIRGLGAEMPLLNGICTESGSYYQIISGVGWMVGHIGRVICQIGGGRKWRYAVQ